MDLQASSRAILLCALLLVNQGACERSGCDYDKYYGAYRDAISQLNFKVPGEPRTVELLEYDCNDLKAVTPATAQINIEGCTDPQKTFLDKLKSGFEPVVQSFCDSRLKEGLDLWSDCFSTKMDVVTECQRKVIERLDKLVADGALVEGDKHCRNKSQSYQCVLQAGADCPPSAKAAKEAVETYMNTSLDLDHCPRTYDPDCDYITFHGCYWNAMSKITFRDHLEPDEVLLKADSLPDDCKAAESVSTCTRNVVIDKCPEQDRTTLRTLQDDFSLTRDSLCKNTQQLRSSIRKWNQCINKEVFQKCLSVDELIRNLLPDNSTKISENPLCRERAEKLKCALDATQSCPSSASLARKAVKDYEFAKLDMDRCLRPNLDGLYGDTGSSTTPKIFVTLGALCLGLLPMKQTLLRQFS